jgi:uncharacterized DUF497 family protein
VIDWTRVSGFDWDAGNARKSGDRHGVTQAEAEQIFFDVSLLVVPDIRHSAQEPRFHALGQTDQCRSLHVTFTLRKDATVVRVISARDMSRKEREVYAKGEVTENPEKGSGQGESGKGNPQTGK